MIIILFVIQKHYYFKYDNIITLNTIIILSVILKRIQKSHKMKVILGKNSNFAPETNKRTA